jgi:pimeloyl-ACP methyl ester carboxylesterase
MLSPFDRMEPVKRQALLASRSETFPYPESTFFHAGAPVMYFDEGSGPPIVFIHGLGANVTHYEYVAPAFYEMGYRTAGLDLPGFGISGKPHRRYTFRYLADAVLGLLDHLGIEQVILCGHSLGGQVAANVALRAPHRVEGLVLISTAGLFAMPLPVRVVARGLLQLPFLGDALEHGAPRLLDRVFAAESERTRRFREQSLTRPDTRFTKDLARVARSMRRDLTTKHLLGVAESLTMPTLLVWGKEDRLLPSHEVGRWARRLPKGELEVLENCGHMPIIEKPEQVVSRILRFAQTHRLGDFGRMRSKKRLSAG